MKPKIYSVLSWLSLLHTRGESRTVAYNEVIARLVTSIPRTSKPILVIGYGLDKLGKELSHTLPLTSFVFVDPFLKTNIKPVIGDIRCVQAVPGNTHAYEHFGPFAAIIYLCPLDHLGLGNSQEISAFLHRLCVSDGRILILGRKTKFYTLLSAIGRQRLEKDLLLSAEATVLFLSVTLIAAFLRLLRKRRPPIAEQLPQATRVRAAGGFYEVYRLVRQAA